MSGTASAGTVTQLDPAEVASYIGWGKFRFPFMQRASQSRPELEELQNHGVTQEQLEGCFMAHWLALDLVNERRPGEILSFMEYLEVLITNCASLHTESARRLLGLDGNIDRAAIVELARRRLDADDLQSNGIKADDVKALRTFLAAMLHELEDCTVYLLIALSKLDRLGRELCQKERPTQLNVLQTAA